MKIKKVIFPIILSCLITFSCQEEKGSIGLEVKEFIRLYKERTQFEDFLNLYNKDMVLEDMVSGQRISGRDNFADFFNWPDTRFKKLEAETIVVESTIIEGNKAVIQGYFAPFIWDGIEVEAMQFTTLLYYDEKGKIIRHVDWINYPNDLIDYSKRSNSNQWIQ